jgi:hypothetical protein
MTKRHFPRIRLKRPTEPVGYGHPPREHQFKPGQSGNPRGRPKGAKNEATILSETLNRKITKMEGGKTQKISVLNGVILRIAEDALKGNLRSAMFLLNRYATMASGESQRNELNEDEREVLESYARRLLAQSKSDGRNP